MVALYLAQGIFKLFSDTNKLKPYIGKLLRGYSRKQLDIAGQATVQVIYEQQVTDLPLVIIAGTQRPALFGRNWLEAIKLNWMELHNIQSHKMQQLLEKHGFTVREENQHNTRLQGEYASKIGDKTDI